MVMKIRVRESVSFTHDQISNSVDQETRLAKFGTYLYEVRELLARNGFSRGKQADNYDRLHDIAWSCCSQGKSIADCAKEIRTQIR